MVKAGALYLSIITAFVIAVICASLIMIAANFKSSSLKDKRMSKLYRNMDSAISLVLAEAVEDTVGIKRIDLFDDQSDSVIIKNHHWGVFGLASIQCFTSVDTLTRSFLIGLATEHDGTAVYLSDEDRPLSVSGDTRIMGNAVAPKSGIRKSYAEGKPYLGEKTVYGAITDSKRTLPGLTEKWITEIEYKLKAKPKQYQLFKGGNQYASFLMPLKEYNASATELLSDSLSGQIILYSDTLLHITSNAHLNNVVIFAKSIIIDKGFSGNAQLFARDSIVIGSGSVFTYPSVIAVMSDQTKVQSKITLGEEVKFDGIILTHEPQRSALQTMISIGRGTIIKGEVYATGLIKLDKKVMISGKTSCNRFIMQTSSTMYENFLIDVTFNRKSRPKAYLTSGIFKGIKEDKKILRWQN